jgi:zinc protease
MMRPLFLLIATALVIAGALPGPVGALPAHAVAAVSPAAATAPLPDIAFQRFVLDNGLTVVVHEDHKAPVVAVSVWYHIGSADEPAGRTGFAHLFEHLMFSGSENNRGTYFQPFEQAGATDMNGTTWFDRTNYYETVPSTAVDMALWMESDRMGHLLGAIGQQQLDTQRGVVKNEKRQGENSPYGRVSQNILSNLYPANHPYQHDSIGSMEDLDAATLDDVKQWFHDNYGAANTTLVLAGDITAAQAREKAERYFGHIAAGRAVPRQRPWVTPLARSTRGVQHDQVPQPRIYRTWVAPPSGSDDALMLELATTVLGGGKTSRLYQRLAYQDALVDDISAGILPLQLASQLSIQADVKAGIEPARVEAAIADELQAFLRDGPSADELERARIELRAGFVRGLEKVGSKAALLAEGQVYRNDPGALRDDLQRLQAADAAEVRAAAQRWLTQGDYLLTVLPAQDGFDAAAEDAAVTPRRAADGRPQAVVPATVSFTPRASAVDRSVGVPDVDRFPSLTFPAIERGRLRNGVELLLARRSGVPATQVELLFDGGFASDPGDRPGTAAFTAALMGESTQQSDSLAIARQRQRLGAQTAVQCGLDSCSAALDALNEQLAPSLALLAQMVRTPAFDAADIARVRGTWLAGIAQEKSQPVGMAVRVLPPLLYGQGHPYARPLSGTGDEASIKALSADALRRYHAQWVRPDNLRILVAGDISLQAAITQLDTAFGDWKAPAAPMPRVALPEAAPQPVQRIFLIDKPDAPQSLILAGLLAPPTTTADNLALGMANSAFGGTFTSRLNMNLRENKRWAYGAQTFMMDAKGQRPYLFYAPVQTDRTADSVAEIARESRELTSSRPLQAAEVAQVRNQRIRALPGSYETNAAVLKSLEDTVQYKRPDDYVPTLKARLEAIDAAAAQAALAAVVKPEAMTWVIIGDRRQVEAPLRALKLAPVQVLDSDGRPRD